jgi:tetratricopeptide (TPR) repeat protein
VTEVRRVRINLRALIVSMLTMGLLVGAVAWLQMTQSYRLRSGVLDLARRLIESGQGAKAIRHLDEFLAGSPRDIPALELKAGLLADSARDINSIGEAARINDYLLRIDPEGANRQETRRRLIDLDIRFSDLIRGGTLFQDAPELASRDLRYRSAEAVARSMIARAPADGSAHTLLARALEALSGLDDAGDASAAISEYEAALRLDPHDAVAAEHLASLVRGRLKDIPRSDRVLDALRDLDPDRVQVRLARFRHYDRFDDRVRAAAELAETTRLAPGDVGIKLAAAEYAIRRGDVMNARLYADAIPAEHREGLQFRLLLATIELAERRPDAALETYRAGLASTGGTAPELNWWLAFVLLQVGRAEEARPIVSRYTRLVGEKELKGRFLRALLDEKSARPLVAIGELESLAGKLSDSLAPTLFMTLGRCYEAVGDERKAIDAYRRAAAAVPTLAAPRLATAKLLESRRPDEAVAYLAAEARSASADSSLKVALAEILLRRQAASPLDRRSWRDFDVAFDAAARADPSGAAVAMMRADRMSLVGDSAGALALLEAATRTAPRDTSIWVAYASALERAGRIKDALIAIDAASAPSAAGDRVPLRIARARLLTANGRGREARDRLVKDVSGFTPTERVAIQEELARLHAAQGDIASARSAIDEWARLAPGSPEPRLALLAFALSSEDDALIRSTVESIRGSVGPNDILGRLCRVVELLRGRGPSGKDAEEAERLLEEIRAVAPEVPTVALLRGELFESLGKVDQAAAEYRIAWQRGVDPALPKLVVLLARHGKVEALAALRRDRPADARLERLLAVAAKSIGNGQSIEALVGTSASDRAAVPEARAARAEALAAAGKVAEAEALLLARAQESRGNEGAWLDLLRFQVANGRSQAIASTITATKAAVKSRKPEVIEAGCLAIAGDRAGADRAMEAALKAYPNDIDVQTAAAGVAQAAGRTTEVIARLRRVLELDPAQTSVARQLSVVLVRAARDVSDWDRVWAGLEPESSDPEARLIRAYVLALCPDPERRRGAVGILESLLADLNADSPIARTAREYLVPLLIAEKAVDRARQVASTPATRSSNPSAVILYVEALLASRDFEEARRQLDRLRTIDPDDRREARLRVRLIREEAPPAEVVARLERAYLDRLDGPSSEAMGIEVATTLESMGADAWPVAARVAARLVSKKPALGWIPARLAAREGRRDEACRLALDAIAKGAGPEFREAARVALMVASTAATDRKALDAAAAVLDAALKREPNAVDLLIQSGMTRHLQGRYDDEAVLYRSALARDPSNAIARNNLAWIIGEDQRKPSDALTIIDELIRDAGPEASRLGTRGVILFRLGRLDDAIASLEAGIRLRPAAVSNYYLALAYQKAGRADDARRTLDAARRAGLTIADIDEPSRAEYQAFISGLEIKP